MKFIKPEQCTIRMSVQGGIKKVVQDGMTHSQCSRDEDLSKESS